MKPLSVDVYRPCTFHKSHLENYCQYTGIGRIMLERSLDASYCKHTSNTMGRNRNEVDKRTLSRLQLRRIAKCE